jgi:anaerobic magnesium-protoporphyrin IX monomethyl ester cyclase
MTTYSQPMPVVLVGMYRYQNFAVRMLHALLENIEGIQPSTIFFKNFYMNSTKKTTSIEESLFREQIIELNPRIVGLCVYSPHVSTARRLTRIVKENSSAVVVWGGIHPTLSPQMCIKEADIICIGEGEGAFQDLVISLRDGQAYRNIENLWINHDGHVIQNSMRPLIQDLDAIPAAAYGRDSFYFIGSNEISKDDPTILDPILAIMPARGCPFSCSYCVNSLLRPMYRHLGRYTRRRSVGNVIAELKTILALPGQKKEMVEFHDENFGTDESWLNEFERRYPQEIGLPFKVQYNPTLIEAATIGRLVNCGLHRVKFGIEAGTDYIRNQVFGRPGKNSEILALARETSKYKVRIRYDMILDNPYDTEESLKSTLDFLLRLPRPLRFNLYSLQYFPGYPLTQKALEDGHIVEEDVSLDRLQRRMARNWAFVPKLFPFTRKQILQNIIWLFAYGHTNAGMVRQAVFNDSWSSYLGFFYLNFQAVWLGKLKQLKRLMYRKKY